MDNAVVVQYNRYTQIYTKYGQRKVKVKKTLRT